MTKLEFEGNCFESIKMSLTYPNATDMSKVKLEIEASGKRALTCVDTFLLGNAEFHHIEAVVLGGIHTTTLNMPTYLY